MYKKLLFLLVAAGCLTGIYIFSRQSPTTQEYCAFCDSKVLNRQKFYEDDLVLALYTHKPVLPGHCLIIPKRHVERFEMLSDEELVQIGQVIKRVDQAASKVFNRSSYLLLQKNGLDVGQTVPHVHFHYIPREAGDGSTLGFMARMVIANARKPISSAEMQKVVGEMKEAMEEGSLTP